MKRIIEIPDDVVKAIQNDEDYRYDIHTAIAQSTPYNPTGDLISREALIKWIDDSVSQYGHTYSTDMLNMWGLFKDYLINNAPTVVAYPFEQVRELIELNQQFAQEIGDLKRPQGKWIFVNPLQADDPDDGGAYICSECKTGDWNIRGNENFCPNCGADMRDREQENNQKESNNMDWDRSSCEQEKSEQPDDVTFNGVCDLNDGIADPTYINGIIDCSDLGIYPWGNS